MLAIQMEDWEQAERDLQRSLDVFRKLRSRLNIGRSLYQMGNLAVSQGQNDKAARYFDEAHGLFSEIGARLDAQRTETALKDITSN